MNYEQDWGYGASDRAQLKAEIMAGLPKSTPDFLNSYKKSKVAFSSMATTLAFPLVDAIANKAQVTTAITEIMDKTALNGHNTWQGLTFVSLTLISSQVLFTKLDQFASTIKANNKLNSSVDGFIKSEYHI